MIDNMNIFIKGKLKRFPKKAIPSLENPYVRETFNIGSVQLIVYDDDHCILPVVALSWSAAAD